jgi:3-oxoacyl-[acyl-carrier protein] reductase
VNIGSAFSVVSHEGRAAYSSAKSGLLGLTRTAAIEGGADGVLVNAVAPGYVRTDLTEQNNTPERIAEICEAIPMGRLAEPEEVAKLVTFLASEDNTYVTGQLISIDGGFLCQ